MLTDVAAVQRLYAAALALDSASQYGYPLPCPNDLGLVYRLTFRDGTNPLQRAEVQALGCHWVYLSHSDVRRAHPAFLDSLAKTIGLTLLVPSGWFP